MIGQERTPRKQPLHTFGVCNAFVRQRPLELLGFSSPDDHPEDTTLHGRDGSRQPIDSAEEDEVRLAGLIVFAVRDRPPRYVVEWSRQHLAEWPHCGVEDALEDAEEDCDWNVVEEVRSRPMRFENKLVCSLRYHVIWVRQAILGVMWTRWTK